MNLNGEWEFGAGDVQRFDRRIVVPFAPQSDLSGIGECEADVVWYRRRFDAPGSDRLLLHFGAVDYRATVWVNGEVVARHEGGHTPFAADVAHVIREHDNELVVRAEDPVDGAELPRGKQLSDALQGPWFYAASTGIWQTVWLEPLPARAIESLRVKPDFDARGVEFEIGGEGEKRVIATFGGRPVGEWSGDGSKGRILLDEFHAWSPEEPNLYGLEASCGSDHVSSYFGLRKVETKDGRFWLNGQPYVQRLVLDQGYFPGGLLTAGSDAELRRDIVLAKAMGFNGARKHQKVEDPRWLYWADTLGFLVWAEMANYHRHSAQAEARLQAEWEQRVLRDRDQPSIVAWVPVNESMGLKGMEPDVMAALLMRLYRLTHVLDGTRLVMSNDGWQHTVSDLCTLHDYAPAGILRRRYSTVDRALETAAREQPPYLPGFEYRGEPIVLSEFGGIALASSGAFGYTQVAGADELLDSYREMVEALMQPGPVEGFCYTQLTDIDSEQNGLLTFERRPKVDVELLRRATETPKRP
ncbi:MAG TPA: glycoside hydrolase family 2 TIM barrel-domain containing protein [Candidatus Dormibacteraeota bacterium]